MHVQEDGRMSHITCTKGSVVTIWGVVAGQQLASVYIYIYIIIQKIQGERVVLCQ